MGEDLLDIGDEVICKDASYKPENKAAVFRMFSIWITEKKYIVRDVMRNDDIVVGILLQGVKNPIVWMPLLRRMQEPAFAFWRFEKTRGALEIAEEEKECDILEVTMTHPTLGKEIIYTKGK